MGGRHTSAFKLYGIFGFPLWHTLSPVMQEAAFRARGLKAFFLPFEVSRSAFRRLMRNRVRLVLDGFNVTVPYKEMAWELLKPRLTPDARAMGAVNVAFRRKVKWFGANTDCSGFLLSLQKEGKFNPRGKKILVLGAGGAARAVVYGLARRGAREIRIVNRPRFRARREKLIRDFSRIFPRTAFVGLSLTRGDLRKGIKGARLVINATSVGVKHETKQLIPDDLIPRARGNNRLLFFDLVYHQGTRFLKAAKRKGHRTLGGIGMLVFQGAEAFRLWTGHRAPVRVMRSVLAAKGGRVD